MTVALSRRYEPRGACLDLFKYRGPEVLLSGPAGTGKSRACLEKLHHIALLNPGMRGLIVRKTAVSLTSTALVTYREHVAKEAIARGDVKYYGGSAQEPAQFRYTNGSSIMLAGMDKPTRIMSSEYDVIYVQEAIELSEAEWDALSTRLRNGKVTFQQLMADTNPDTPTHWLKARADRGTTVMLDSRHRDNPVLFEADGMATPAGQVYLDRLDNLSGVRKARLRDGVWAAAEGIIYDEFDATVHLIDKHPIPAEWTRYWSIDFGYTNPMVVQRWAVDPDGRLILYAETYHTGRLVEDVAIDHRDRVLKKEPKPRMVIADHDAEGRATWVRYSGLRTTPAKKAVLEGIQAMQSRLKLDGTGRPRLMIMRGAVERVDPSLTEAKLPTCTAEELPGYVWGNSATKEAPLKDNDHGMDAARYVCYQLDRGVRAGLR